MLKIKDNVDLKELEKFGCELHWSGKCYLGGYDNRELHLRIYIDTREIVMCEPFRDNDGTENNIEILFDLIQAGLVEKVSDE